MYRNSLCLVEIAKDRSGLVKKYLDARLASLSDPEEDKADLMKPFAERLLQFTWTARKIADTDEKLDPACFADVMELVSWMADDTIARLKIRS